MIDGLSCVEAGDLKIKMSTRLKRPFHVIIPLENSTVKKTQLTVAQRSDTKNVNVP